MVVDGSAADGTRGTDAAAPTDALPGADACVPRVEVARAASRPVDFVVAIDNTSTMGSEVVALEVWLTRDLYGALGGATPAVDYRIVLVSGFGSDANRELCIGAPLTSVADGNGDGRCDAVPATPAEGARFFHHSPLPATVGGDGISGFNTLCQLGQQLTAADEFNLHPSGYSELLRSDSFKMFLVASDDRVDDLQANGCSFGVYDDGDTVVGGQAVAAQWEADMLDALPGKLGTAADRRFAFHTIGGFAPGAPTPGAPYGDPMPPDTGSFPVTTTECSPSGRSAGTGYQALSVRSGGYRYPICDTEYAKMATRLSLEAATAAQHACVFDAPVGVGLDRIEVGYASGGTPMETWTYVDEAGSCGAANFYEDGGRIALCPAACSTIKGDAAASLSLTVTCP